MAVTGRLRPGQSLCARARGPGGVARLNPAELYQAAPE